MRMRETRLTDPDGNEMRVGSPLRDCASSSLMPQPYGVHGGWRATFTGAVLEYTMRAGLPATARPP
jgi:hypothetical protein